MINYVSFLSLRVRLRYIKTYETTSTREYKETDFINFFFVPFLKGHGNEADFLGFLQKLVLLDPLRAVLIFDFAEIFVIEKRLPDSASRRVGF